MDIANRTSTMTNLKNFKFSLQKKFILNIVLIIVPILGFTFAWTGIRNQRNTIAQLVNQARVLARQIVLTRKWVADSGGVMVLRNSEGARPYNYFFDDRMQTGRGTYNRFTPAMVTKKLSQYSMRENLYHFRLASLNPMNPDNAPDAFEKMALIHFIHQKSNEIHSFDDRDDQQHFRYTIPLHANKACLECHKDFSTGTIAGCLSIFLPSEQVKKELQISQHRLIYSGVALIALTILTLFFLLRHVVIKPVNQMKFMADEIKNGNFNARINLKTDDEFERLGKSFNSMIYLMPTLNCKN